MSTTPTIDRNRGMLASCAIALAALSCMSAARAQEQDLSGTWVRDRAADFDGLVSSPTTELPAALQVLGDRFAMPSGCVVQLLRQPLAMDRVFQSLIKADVSKGSIESYFQKQFGVHVREVRTLLRNSPQTASCYRDVVYLIPQGDTLVASEGGGQFAFLYKRSGAPTKPGVRPVAQLPFQASAYRALCSKGVTWSKQKPVQGTSACAPLYFPLVATADSTDEIARLVGHHNYEGPFVGLRGSLTNDYNDPVSSDLRPIYQQLPPRGSITLVHVLDDEGSSSRDAMPGAYLSIVGGKVVSQLNSNCTMGLDYVCRENGSDVHYTLNAKGAFVQHDK